MKFYPGMEVITTENRNSKSAGYKFVIKSVDGDGDCYDTKEAFAFWHPQQLKRSSVDLDFLYEGDEVRSGSGTRVVLFVLKPGLYVLSQVGNPGVVGSLYTSKELRGMGCIAVQSEATLVEMTVKEAAERMGINPSLLKIKEG